MFKGAIHRAYLSRGGATVMSKETGTTIRRRPESKVPKKLIQMPETKRHWRGYYPGWQRQT